MDCKSKYIGKISAASDRYGDLLLKMMEHYKVIGLMDLSAEQVKEFYYEEVANRRKGVLGDDDDSPCGIGDSDACVK